MGYMSKLYIVERIALNKKTIIANQIATIDMGHIGEGIGWRELFFAKPDYKIYIDEDTETDTDDYGDKLKYAGLEDVIDWTENQIESGNDYRLLPVLLGLLKGISTSDWKNVQIVHYGC